MIQKACRHLKSIKTHIIPGNTNFHKFNQNLTIKASFQSILFPNRFVNTLKYSFAEEKRTESFKKKLSK